MQPDNQYSGKSVRPGALLLSVLVTLLTACGGGGGNPGGGGTGGGGGGTGGGGGPSNGTTLTRSQIAACPNLSTSSDPGATSCIKSKIVGKTLSGDACTLTIGDSGSFTYASAALNLSVTPSAGAIRVFSHTSTLNLLLWRLIEGNAELKLDYNLSQDYKLDIEIKNGNAVSTCTVTL